MTTLRGSRPDRDSYFVQMASLVAQRSTCIRRAVGCILVNYQGHVLATGYNGVCHGAVHCIDRPCPGADQASGQGLHMCEAIHAEQNALIQCRNINEIHTAYVTASPCIQCMRLLINTSIKRIVFPEVYPHAESEKLAKICGIEWAHYVRDRSD